MPATNGSSMPDRADTAHSPSTPGSAASASTTEHGGDHASVAATKPAGNWNSRRNRFLLLSGMFLAGIAVVGLINASIDGTNTLEFCVSCHTMDTPYEEYKTSKHYMNAAGVQATCADCHVPKQLGPKLVTKVVAAKDVWHEILGTIDTPEKFEARRWKMASRIWDIMERSDSRECRTCHEFKSMDLSEQGRTARARHARAEERGQTCINCHSGIVHGMPSRPTDDS